MCVIPLCVSLLCLHMYRSGHGGALTSRPLRIAELFQVELLQLSINGCFQSIGVTSWRLVILVMLQVFVYAHVNNNRVIHHTQRSSL